jgi:hypothetical protein
LVETPVRSQSSTELPYQGFEESIARLFAAAKSVFRLTFVALYANLTHLIAVV